jgi:hypothetical protein
MLHLLVQALSHLFTDGTAAFLRALASALRHIGL